MENNEQQNPNTFEQPSENNVPLRGLKRSRIKIIIPIAVVFVVGLGLIAYSQLARSDSCKKLDQQAQYSCYSEAIAKAKSKQDLSICKSIKTQDYKEYCFNEMAVAKKDISICNKISGSEGLNECYSDVLDSLDTVGHFGATVSLCNSLKDGWAKDGCYYKAGVESKDIAVCDKIQNKESGTFSNCYIYVGIALNDIYVCEKEMVESNTCYRAFADSLNDVSICEKIDSQKDKNFCYSEYAYRHNNPSSCDKILDNESRDFCYRSSNEPTLPALGRGSSDFSVCAKIQNLDEKDFCYSDAIRAVQDFSCSKVDGKQKDYCLTSAANIKTDTNFCKPIESLDEKGRCYGKIYSSYVYIELNKGTERCVNITDSYVRDSCYFNYAKYKPDYSVCSLIKDKYYSDECYKWAARKNSPGLTPEQ